MKKYLFMTLLSIILLSSCTPDDDPVPVELAPTIQLSVSNSSILYSTDVTISWTSTNAKSVSINGESMTSVNGSKTYSSLITNTTFVALATNVVKTATDSKTVTVAEEPTPTAELTISPNDAVLPYGKDITVSWNITNFKTATLNGEAINTATGSKVFSKLLATTDFAIVVTNFTKSVTTKKTVTVGDWTSSRFGLLTHNQKHWVLNRFEFFQNGIVVDVIPVHADMIGWYYVYSFNGTWIQRDKNNYSLGDGTWELTSNDTQLKWTSVPGGPTTIVDIYNLTETELSFVENVYYNNLPAKFVRTWKIQE